jgi:hypothetical protein
MVKQLFLVLVAAALIWWQRAIESASITVNVNNKVDGACGCCGGGACKCCNWEGGTPPATVTVAITLISQVGSYPDFFGGTYTLPYVGTDGGTYCDHWVSSTGVPGSCFRNIGVACLTGAGVRGCSNVKVSMSYGNIGGTCGFNSDPDGVAPDSSPACSCSPLSARYTIVVEAFLDSDCCGISHGSGWSNTYQVDLYL